MITEDPVDKIWMARALELAALAYEKNEIPVGALIVCDGNVVAEAFNLKETTNNPLGHAETLAIQKASESKNSWRLADCTLYVTLEPCLMCVGAITHSRIKRIVYGASDPKAGAIESVYQIFDDKKLNHRPEVSAGILNNQCSEILTNFFKKLRTV